MQLRLAFESSNISHATYDPDDKRLVVYFANNTVYAYRNVERDLWDEWEASMSAGEFFHRRIRNGGYPYEKINA